MNIEIKYKYTIPSGYYIKKAIAIDESNTVILLYQYPYLYSIEIIGEINKFIELSSFGNWGNVVLFKYKHGFGLFVNTDTIIIWNNLESEYETFTVSNAFLPDKFGRELFPIEVIYDDYTRQFFVSLEDYGSRFGPAKYWSTIRKSGISDFLNRINLSPRYLKWESLYVKLNLDYFPPTCVDYCRKFEWLNIRKIALIEGNFFFNSNGGSATRTKSGPEYQFNIVLVINKKGELLNNIPIEYGTVFFTYNNKYLIVNSHKNKNKLILYSIPELIEVDNITFPKNKNLDFKFSNSVKFDLVGCNLLVYNTDYLLIYKTK